VPTSDKTEKQAANPPEQPRRAQIPKVLAGTLEGRAKAGPSPPHTCRTRPCRRCLQAPAMKVSSSGTETADVKKLEWQYF
jgi:hypothetical protein